MRRPGLLPAAGWVWFRRLAGHGWVRRGLGFGTGLLVVSTSQRTILVGPLAHGTPRLSSW